MLGFPLQMLTRTTFWRRGWGTGIVVIEPCSVKTITALQSVLFRAARSLASSYSSSNTAWRQQKRCPDKRSKVLDPSYVSFFLSPAGSRNTLLHFLSSSLLLLCPVPCIFFTQLGWTESYFSKSIPVSPFFLCCSCFLPRCPITSSLESTKCQPTKRQSLQ
jgi:hypothetical protein